MTDEKKAQDANPEPEKPSGNGSVISPWAKETASKRLSWNTDYLMDYEIGSYLHGPYRTFSVPLWPVKHCDLLPAPSGFPSPMGDEAFYGIVGEVIRIIAPRMEACREALLMQFLVAVGNLVGRGAYLDQGEARHHMNEFLVLVGPTSSGRKGTSWRAIKNLCAAVDQAWLSGCVLDGIQSGEAVVNRVRDSQMRTFKTGSGYKTEEDQGVSDKRLLLMEEELARLLAVARRDNNPLSAILRQAWDGEKYMNIASKNSPEKATDAHISLIAHITSEELKARLQIVDYANGFLNRIMFCATRTVQRIAVPQRIQWAEHAALVERLLAVRNSFKTGRGIRFSEDGRSVWNQFYRSVNDNLHGNVGKLLGRTEAHVLRLSMIYAALDNRDPCLIEPEHILAAIAVWDYCSASVRYVFGNPSTGPVRRLDSNPEKLYQALPGHEMTTSQIQNDVFKKNKSAEEVRQWLTELKDTGRARSELRKGENGKDVEYWSAINPAKC
jgi:hypothetical protein